MQSVPLRRRAAIAMIAAAALATVTGCAATSPAIITDPYLAADGTDAHLTLDDGTVIELTNFLVVLGKKGQPGQVIGGVTYSGTGPQRMAIQAKDAATVPPVAAEGGKTDPESPEGMDGGPAAQPPGMLLEAVGGELVQLGPDGTSFVLPVVNVEPGQYIQLTATSPVAGSVTWNVPVLAPNHQYAGLTATVAPSGTATPSPTPEAGTPEATPTEDTGTPETTGTTTTP